MDLTEKAREEFRRLDQKHPGLSDEEKVSKALPAKTQVTVSMIRKITGWDFIRSAIVAGELELKLDNTSQKRKRELASAIRMYRDLRTQLN